jgi:hypothetical protein
MSILDVIMQLTGRKDPAENMRQQILNGGAGGGGGVPEPPVAPQPPTAASAATSPSSVTPPYGEEQPDPQTTASIPQEQVSNAYKSPPDLAQLYLELQKRDSAAREFDQGATLIAAGLARDENRSRIMDTYQETPADNQSSMFTTLQNIQKYQNEMAVKAQMRLALPNIAKQYGLSMEEVSMMFENGTLEEFLQAKSGAHPEVREGPNGQVIVVDPTKPEAGVKELTPPGTEWVERADGSKVLVSKGSGKPVGGGEAVTSTPPKTRDIIQIDDPEGGGGKISVYKDDLTRIDTGEKVTVSKPKQEIKYLEQPDGGKLATDGAGNRKPELDIPPVNKITIQKDAQGQFQALDSNGKPVGSPFGSKEDKSTDDMKEYAAARFAAENRGEHFDEFDKWLAERERLRAPSGTANWDPATKTDLGEPPKDKQWARNADGSIKRDESGAAVSVTTPGSETARKEEEAAATAADKEAGKTRVSNIVTAKADEALKILDSDSWTSPVTGITGAVAAAIPGSARADLEASLSTLKANTTFERLQKMRDESPTGGALGNVSDSDLRLLSATIASLDPNQSKATLQRNIKLVQGVMSGDPDAIKDFQQGVATSGNKKKTADEILAERRRKK